VHPTALCTGENARSSSRRSGCVCRGWGGARALALCRCTLTLHSPQPLHAATRCGAQLFFFPSIIFQKCIQQKFKKKLKKCTKICGKTKIGQDQDAGGGTPTPAVSRINRQRRLAASVGAECGLLPLFLLLLLLFPFASHLRHRPPSPPPHARNRTNGCGRLAVACSVPRLQPFLVTPTQQKGWGSERWEWVAGGCGSSWRIPRLCPRVQRGMRREIGAYLA
jgi:hypothetical protein